MDALIVDKVLGGDTQDVVVFARHQMAGKHVRTALDRRLEVRQRLLELTRQRYMHDRRRLMAERGVRQPRVIAADGSGFLQIVQAPGAGRLRQSNLLGKRRVGYPAILLQSLQNGDINPIERHFS